MISKEKLLKVLEPLKPEINGNDIICDCPWCGHREFGVSIEVNPRRKQDMYHPWNCFRKKSCGVSGFKIFYLLREIGTLKLLGKEYFNKEGVISITFNEDNKESVDNINLEMPNWDLPIGYERIYSNEYLDLRGFKDFNRYEVGITNIESRYFEYVIFPVYRNKTIKGYVSRYTGKDEEKLRYNNSKSELGKTLYGYDEVNSGDSIILVEGIFDKFNIDHQLELKKNSKTKCLSTLGAKISDEQIKLLKLKSTERVILMFDPDVPKIIDKASETLNNHFDLFVSNYYGNKDPGEFTKEEAIERIKNAKKIQDILIFNIKN